MRTKKELPVVIEDEDCGCTELPDEEPECVDPMVYASYLSQETGVSVSKINKWGREGLIPSCKRPHEWRMFPKRKTIRAIKDILKEGGLN